MRRILIVCTGNTCRSPMAESMLKDLAARNGKPVEVRSAGVAALSGQPVSPHAVQTLKKRNLPVPGPSSMLTAEDVAWADLILTLTTNHKRAILEKHPEALSKTFTLKEFALHGEAAMDDVAEAERLYSEWQMRQALGQDLTDEERARLFELQRRIPNFDITDPFGGPLAIYERCADEIEDALLTVIEKMDGEAKKND